jgi:hypothetical protein
VQQDGNRMFSCNHRSRMVIRWTMVQMRPLLTTGENPLVGPNMAGKSRNSMEVYSWKNHTQHI